MESEPAPEPDPAPAPAPADALAGLALFDRCPLLLGSGRALRALPKRATKGDFIGDAAGAAAAEAEAEAEAAADADEAS